ncbi:hypothetical protein EMPS_00935 [Entomortierella parvispora]|uniref:Uncharacterized protein n=1 Tax=Entomortierella parvispora TaxID=205924 RepID=A0A9P3LS74_9FUNG|nr:hypothetical protein EMPS_00935 [Entomortierella parvispora]
MSSYSSHTSPHNSHSASTGGGPPRPGAFSSRTQSSGSNTYNATRSSPSPTPYSPPMSHHSYSSSSNNNNNININTGTSGAATHGPIDDQGFSQIYAVDYSSNQSNASTTAPTSPTTTLFSSHTPARGNSPAMAFSNTPLPTPTKWKKFRLRVMKMATVERLQLLWALLAILGTISWIALMPALGFRHKVDDKMFKVSVYTFFLVATIGTSLSAIWQSLCPFLIRQSQRALLPRIINHPATQTATILISVILTILNFFSWIILASNEDAGAKTNCQEGPLSKEAGYTAQCRGVNVAVATDAVVFLLWIPISVVIVCGTIERGLWWWGEDDGWAQNEAIVGGSNMMSEEEFDMKIGMGGSKQIQRRQTVHPDNQAISSPRQEMVMIQQPKPAFVTPIASQFRSTSSMGSPNGGMSSLENADDEEDYTNFTPSSYRKHHRQRQQQSEPRRLTRRASSNSLSSRLSTFFGAGWSGGSMPEPDQMPAMPEMPSQYRQHQQQSNSSVKPQQQRKNNSKAEVAKEQKEEEEDTGPLHGAEYSAQWHSRWA